MDVLEITEMGLEAKILVFVLNSERESMLTMPELQHIIVLEQLGVISGAQNDFGFFLEHGIRIDQDLEESFRILSIIS
jgi:hypothetical protein